MIDNNSRVFPARRSSSYLYKFLPVSLFSIFFILYTFFTFFNFLSFSLSFANTSARRFLGFPDWNKAAECRHSLNLAAENGEKCILSSSAGAQYLPGNILQKSRVKNTDSTRRGREIPKLFHIVDISPFFHYYHFHQWAIGRRQIIRFLSSFY